MTKLSLRVLERGTIYAPDAQSTQRVACYPNLLRLRDGRILCSFRVGESKDGPDEKLCFAESRDDGQSWHRIEPELDASLNGVPGSLSFAGAIEPEPGEVLLLATWINRSNPTLPVSNPQTAGCLEMKLVKATSRDGARNWSVLEEIATPFPQAEVSGPPIALSEPGHLLLPMENQKEFDDPEPIDEKCYAMLSRDGGRSWPEWAIVAHDHPARKFWCNRAARLPDGKIAFVHWAFDSATARDLPIHISFGSPDGTTWSGPQSTGVEGQVSYLLPLDESTLLMATSHRLAPAGIRLRQSHDGGHSWDEDGLLVFDAHSQAAQSGGDLGEYYQHMTGYTFGWSPMLRLSDTTLLLAFFAGEGETINIHWAKVGW